MPADFSNWDEVQQLADAYAALPIEATSEDVAYCLKAMAVTYRKAYEGMGRDDKFFHTKLFMELLRDVPGDLLRAACLEWCGGDPNKQDAFFGKFPATPAHLKELVFEARAEREYMRWWLAEILAVRPGEEGQVL